MNKKVDSLIAFFGTQGKTAKAVGCSQTTVFKWLHEQMQVSPLYAQKIEIITGGEFKAVDLCPRLAEVEQLKALYQTDNK